MSDTAKFNVGAWLLAIGTAFGIYSVLKSDKKKSLNGSDEVDELVLYATNDADLYRQRIQPIIKNLQKKVKKGIYDKNKALVMWKRVADEAAKKYLREFGSPGDGNNVFTVQDRKEAAKDIADKYKEEIEEIA
jgi:hypothetical protein